MYVHFNGIYEILICVKKAIGGNCMTTHKQNSIRLPYLGKNIENKNKSFTINS